MHLLRHQACLIYYLCCFTPGHTPLLRLGGLSRLAREHVHWAAEAQRVALRAARCLLPRTLRHTLAVLRWPRCARHALHALRHTLRGPCWPRACETGSRCRLRAAAQAASSVARRLYVTMVQDS